MITEKVYKADIDISDVVYPGGDNTIIAAPSGTSEYIAIDHINLIPDSAGTIQLRDGGVQLPYGGIYSLAANQHFVLDNTTQDPDGIITLTVGAPFDIRLYAAGQVTGFVRYRIRNR